MRTVALGGEVQWGGRRLAWVTLGFLLSPSKGQRCAKAKSSNAGHQTGMEEPACCRGFHLENHVLQENTGPGKGGTGRW